MLLHLNAEQGDFRLNADNEETIVVSIASEEELCDQSAVLLVDQSSVQLVYIRYDDEATIQLFALAADFHLNSE